jgi:hypothetical protein
VRISSGWIFLIAFAAGCTLLVDENLPQNPSSTPTVPSSYPWRDANAVMSGICFESAYDAAGQVFVLRDAEAHIHFYELADNSHLCRHPVTRNAFDFSSGSILAGLWSKGIGCTARHDVTDFERDDAAKRLVIRLMFITEGNCNYELVRPFWVGLDGVTEYTIEITVE